jgi:hypothetical protein
MVLFRSKNETDAEAGIAADIAPGLRQKPGSPRPAIGFVHQPS